MVELPPAIRALYRIATTHDVRSWSFGQLKAVRTPNASSWQEMKGSLDDQAIFGPRHDFVCACGKYEGGRHKNMICDLCGVKVAPARIRRSRFAHIELSTPVPHPLSDSGEPIEAFQLLPASYFESAHGAGLAELYEVLLRATWSGNAVDIAHAIGQIVELLLPIVIQAHAWNLRDADTLTRGLGLMRKSAGAKGDGRCECCGYLIAGLELGVCPGCGETIGRR